ncbi:hypothetical protein SISNIDRAFT_460789 [Sistotremastrum niveocremeum HHB9708]|uniref:F-box domain-containing protein n=1 Tax=Sistotremastrum niveocremeum HHB9708 TaxID=1314777 RepID=A0A164N9Y6_9AGAM|nr:hypothetical protein SISNIDRAFT_460789 [Sistotremastrum niveocremeum HHB9708]
MDSGNDSQIDGISRFPIEIWRTILSFATALPFDSFADSDSPLWESLRELCPSTDPNHVNGHDVFRWCGLVHEPGPRAEAWRSACQIKVSVVLTCRTWRAIGEEMLYESLRHSETFFSIKQLSPSDASPASPGGIRAWIPLTNAHLVQQIEWREKWPWDKLFSFASHCVNLVELFLSDGPDRGTRDNRSIWDRLDATIGSLIHLRTLIIDASNLGEVHFTSSLSETVILPELETFCLNISHPVNLVSHWRLPMLVSLSLVCADVDEFVETLQIHGSGLSTLALMLTASAAPSHPIPLQTLCPVLQFFSCLNLEWFDVMIPILVPEHPSLETLGVFSLKSIKAGFRHPLQVGPGFWVLNHPKEMPGALKSLTRSRFPRLRVIRQIKWKFAYLAYDPQGQSKPLDPSVIEHCDTEGLAIESVLGGKLATYNTISSSLRQASHRY